MTLFDADSRRGEGQRARSSEGGLHGESKISGNATSGREKDRRWRLESWFDGEADCSGLRSAKTSHRLWVYCVTRPTL